MLTFIFGNSHVVDKGLVFLHEQGIAHRYVQHIASYILAFTLYRDCAEYNIMMDADALYPRGYHPVGQSFLPDNSAIAPRLSREHHRVKYYYVDFGISSYIPPGSSDRLVVGEFGREREVPELSATVPYDPFKVDVFIIGNLLKKSLQEVRARVYWHVRV